MRFAFYLWVAVLILYAGRRQLLLSGRDEGRAQPKIESGRVFGAVNSWQILGG
jgi:hypothetical protein